ncbi:MAG: hypothetical protein ACD_23C00119G0001 [uncultured bacterium]|nr:MAG: hypothetical protein ACD_23C00119G0001 [uncultured bacterium]
MGVINLVVHAVQHAVFECDEVPWRMLQIAVTGIQQLPDRIFAVQRNKIVAQCIIGRMQGNGQRHRTVLCQTVHHGDNTRSRHRNAPARQAVTVVIQHDLERRYKGRIVLQWLAHAHHHHIGNDAGRPSSKTLS